MSRSLKPPVITLLSSCLRPIARFCLRHGIKQQEVNELFKQVSTEEALAELQRLGKKVTTSQLSIMTGIHRKDLVRLEQAKHSGEPGDKTTLVAKIIGQWQTDKRFCTKQRAPRVLTCQGPTSEFASLVGANSTDISPTSILFELERSGTIIKTAHGIKLAKLSYTPAIDPETAAPLMERDLEGTLQAIEENVLEQQTIKNVHAATVYDKVRAEALPELRRWLLKEGHQFHERVRQKVAQYDQDLNPQSNWKGKVARVWLATLSLTDRISEKEE